MLTIDEFSEIIEIKFNNENSTITKVDGMRTGEIYPPELDDLYRLYAFIIDNCVISILEFGAGWSTLALALGLSHNRDQFAENYPNYDRNPHAFSICSVDNSNVFMQRALSRLDSKLQNIVIPHIATPIMSKVGVHSVTTWHPVPRFDYDLIYLDAPEPEQVSTSNDYIQMSSIHDLPIAGDLIVNEPYLLPQTSVIIDGRTSNARYLASNVYRNWESMTSYEADFTLLHLDENPIGRINARHINFRLENSFNFSLKYLRQHE